MRLNILVLTIICGTLWMCSCNSSKSAKTAKADTTEAVKEAVEKVEETATSIKDEVVDKVEDTAKEAKEIAKESKEAVKSKMDKAETKVEETKDQLKLKMDKAEDKIEETKEAVQAKMDKTETTASPVKQVDVKQLQTSKTKVAATQKMQAQKTAMVGKYKWLKRVCCGRMQKTTLPADGEETYMTLTKEGKVIYSGNALKNAENTEFSLDMNFKSFPDRPMLKVGKSVPALMQFYGDTLLIDRGYIDLDKNYWLKVE